MGGVSRERLKNLFMECGREAFMKCIEDPYMQCVKNIFIQYKPIFLNEAESLFTTKIEQLWSRNEIIELDQNSQSCAQPTDERAHSEISAGVENPGCAKILIMPGTIQFEDRRYAQKAVIDNSTIQQYDSEALQKSADNHSDQDAESVHNQQEAPLAASPKEIQSTPPVATADTSEISSMTCSTEEPRRNARNQRQTDIPRAPVDEKSPQNGIGFCCNLSFRHPLVTTSESKQVDRSPTINDCFGNPPVIVAYEVPSGRCIAVRCAILSSSSNGVHYGLSKLFENEQLVSRRDFPVTYDGNSLRPTMLRKLKVQKEEDSTIQSDDNSGRPSQKNVDCKLVRFTFNGDERELVRDRSRLEVIRKYKLKEQQLFVWIPNENGEEPRFQVWSNQLQTMKELEKNARLEITNVSCSDIFQDEYFGCEIGLTVKIPDFMLCTLGSGQKWLKVSITTNPQISKTYYFYFENNPKCSERFAQIKNLVVPLKLKIIKDLSGLTPKNDVDYFQINIKIIHSEQSEEEVYEFIPPWTSDKYTIPTNFLNQSELPRISTPDLTNLLEELTSSKRFHDADDGESRSEASKRPRVDQIDSNPSGEEDVSSFQEFYDKFESDIKNSLMFIQ